MWLIPAGSTKEYGAIGGRFYASCTVSATQLVHTPKVARFPPTALTRSWCRVEPV